MSGRCGSDSPPAYSSITTRLLSAAPQLAKLDRYERRALSRRNKAIGKLSRV